MSDVGGRKTRGQGSEMLSTKLHRARCVGCSVKTKSPALLCFEILNPMFYAICPLQTGRFI